MTRKYTKHATFNQQKEIEKIIRANATVDDLKFTMAYNPGWNDIMIAEKVGVSPASVRKVRLEAVGDRTPRVTLDPMDHRLSKLEDRVKVLEDLLK